MLKVRTLKYCCSGIPWTAEAEEVGPVLGVAEVVGGRPVDRNGPCVRGGVAEGRLSCVDGQRFNVEFLVAHVAFSFLSFGREHYRISPSHCIIGINILYP